MNRDPLDAQQSILRAIEKGEDVLTLCQSCGRLIPLDMATFLGGLCKLCFVWKHPDRDDQQRIVEDTIDRMTR